MRRSRRPWLGCSLVALVTGCGRPGTTDPCVGTSELGDTPVAITLTPGQAGQWWSSESHAFDLDHPDTIWFECPRAIEHKLDRQPDLPITALANTSATTIDIDPAVTYQTILGTGISMEAASVANILQLSPSKQHELLVRIFDPVNGMGLELVRVTIGTSDFTGTDWYTEDDVPAGQQDPDLARFSIQRDVDLGIVGVLRQIVAINPSIKFFASPWSPPAWMKHGEQIAGGSLRDDAIDALATYLRMFAEAYRAQGIPIYAMTMQNEPRSQESTMPTCLVTAQQEARLAKALAHELSSAGLSTRVWLYDHNFDAAVDYATDAFADDDALAVTDGVAFHDYGGDPSAMTEVHARYPTQHLVFTEKTLWGVAGVDRAAQFFRNWSTTYVSWLTMLDQNGGPNRGPNSEKPRRFIRSITYTGDEYYATPEHYLFGLYSRFVQPGAIRIDSSPGATDTVTDVAFANPDGTIVVVAINQTKISQSFVLRCQGRQITATLDAKTAASYVWRVE